MRPRLSISSRFAFRNLSRNIRRSLLSVAGVAIGCSIALTNISAVRGKIDLFTRNIAEGGIGHLRVVPDTWAVTHDSALRLKDWQGELAMVRALAGVRVATPRARVQAMLAMGTRISGVEIVGVDPETEPATYRYVRQLESGRYLTPRDSQQMVIGRGVADRLRIGLGDSVVVTVVDATGSMKSEMFDVLGIVNLGSRQFDSSICQVNLRDVEMLSGLSGAGEIAVILDRPDEVDSVIERLKPSLPAGDTALSWAQIRPDSRVAVAINEATSRILTGILVFVAFLGVASAQLTAVLERRREFAVLTAIGMSARRIASLVMSEAIVLGTASLLVTVILAGPILHYFAVVGIRVLSPSQSVTFGGAVFDPIFHFDFGPWFFGYAAFLCYFSTILASIYPAVFAVRLDPAEALRVAQ